MRRHKDGMVEIPELEDPNMSLREWREIIDRLAKEYGEEAMLLTDAGYNNVSMRVEKVKP